MLASTSRTAFPTESTAADGRDGVGQTVGVIRDLTAEDIGWVAEQMEWRRALYAALSPRFWNPAVGVTEAHQGFLTWLIGQPGIIGLRSDRAFAIGTVQSNRLFVDDFAVEEDNLWLADGRLLLEAMWEAAPDEVDHLRVVTAKFDAPKCRLLEGLGLRPGARWWVGAVDGTEDAAEHGPHTVAGHDVTLMDAPPVYDPGGLVCLTDLAPLLTTAAGPVDAEKLEAISLGAAELGAALLILTDDPTGGNKPPEDRPDLTGIGFHNPSVFYDGPLIQEQTSQSVSLTN